MEEVIVGLREMPSAFVTDAMRRLGLSEWTECVLPLSKRARRIAGPAVTIQYGPKGKQTRQQQISVYRVIREATPGSVLVFAGCGTPCWLIGENFCHDAMYHGLEGFVVDGCVRDSGEITEMSWPVFCRGAGIRPWSTHLSLVGINSHVEFAGASINAGDIIVGDGDGLAVVPFDRAKDVLTQAREIAVLEKQKEEAIKRRAPVDELIQMSAAKRSPKIA